MIGKFIVFLMLGIHHFALGHDVEDSAPTTYHLSFKSECFFDFCRQTGGFGLIVSLGAIRDRDFHALPFSIVTEIRRKGLLLTGVGLVRQDTYQQRQTFLNFCQF